MEGHSYYTDDKQDAIDTARQIRKEAEAQGLVVEVAANLKGV